MINDSGLSPEVEFSVALSATGETQVGLDDVETPAGRMRVSTILSPVKVAYGKEYPYETDTFDADGCLVHGRSAIYASRGDAAAGHALMVATVRGEVSDG